MPPARRRLRVAAGWLLLAGLLPQPASSKPAPDDRQRQVLVVYSTRRDAQVALVGERDLPRIIEDGVGGRLDYYAEFIDPGRFSDPAYQEALSTFLRKKYEDHHFELVVTVGGPATAFAGSPREIFAGAAPVVFYGNSKALPRPGNATGVIGELDFAGTVSLAATLDPMLQHV